MVHGVPGRRGRTVMSAPARPRAPGNATVLLPGLVVCPVSERAGRAAVAMTTSPSAQVSTMQDSVLIVDAPSKSTRVPIQSEFIGLKRR